MMFCLLHSHFSIITYHLESIWFCFNSAQIVHYDCSNCPNFADNKEVENALRPDPG